MSFAASAALQEAVYSELRGDAGISATVGNNIFDALPAGELPETYISIGPELVRDRSDVTGAGSEHSFEVAIVTQSSGFAAAKTLAGLVEARLTSATMALAQGRLVGLWFDRATARRSGKAGRIRRIDLRFRARIDNS